MFFHGMKKTFLIIALLAATLLPNITKAQIAPPGDWRVHNTFGSFFKSIIVTPDRVYLLALGIGSWSWSTSYSTEYPALFVYDKNDDIIEGYNGKNYLHGSIIKDMWYNAAKKYFLLVYDDYNIDILYTDDRCYNVPGYASAVVPGGKDINSISFDPENNRAYIATKFGYLVVDDKKNVISESHIYGVNIKSIIRVDNYLLAAAEDGVYISDLKRNDLHSSWSSFSKVADGPAVVNDLLTLKDNNFLYINDSNRLFKGSIDSDGKPVFDTQDLAGTNITAYNEIKDGYFMTTGWEGKLVDREGNVRSIPGSSTYRSALYGACDANTLWRPLDEKGIEKLCYKDGAWKSTPSPTYGNYILPDAPNVFDVGAFSYSPKYGMIGTNACYAHFHGSFDVGFLSLASCYKDNKWYPKNLYRLSGSNNAAMRSTHSGILDTEDEDILWVGSGNAGLGKYNLSNNTTKRFNPGGGSPNCLTPKFDGDGTLWTVRQTPTTIYYWKKEDRLAEDGNKIKGISIPEYTIGAFGVFLPCSSEQSRNYIVVSKGVYDSGLFVYDHRGTLDNTSDDRKIVFTSLKDQDGQSINITYVYCMMEDPATGRVWVGGEGGLYWFNPKDAFNSDFHVNRVKVARNDGTGLADYLLEGASIYSMGIDGAGHKWFGTLGNGVVETTASGDEIIRQLTYENSYLPSNDVISIGFEDNSNCVWLGTKKGIAQYFSETAPGAEKLDDVLAFPNPVRPDYYGHVTIKGLMDGSLVKILDASGGIVRELGRSEGGMMLWDLTNSAGKRVPTGVYYVASSTSGDSSEANVAKILVMN